MYCILKQTCPFSPIPTWRRRASRAGRELKSFLSPSRPQALAVPSLRRIPTRPPSATGRGPTRHAQARLDLLAISRLQAQQQEHYMLPSGKPLGIEIPRRTAPCSTIPFSSIFSKLGVQANLRIVDPAQLKSRTEAFVQRVGRRFRIDDARRRLRRRSRQRPRPNGSRNLAGVADPVVDALIGDRLSEIARSSTPLAALRSSCAPAIIGSRCGITTPHA